MSTLFVRLQHWPCSLSLLQAHNTIANTGFHTPAFDTSTRSKKITTLWSLNRRRLRVIHKREAPSSKYLLFAAGNSCVCVHFPALPVAFQVGCISSQLPSASRFFRRFHLAVHFLGRPATIRTHQSGPFLSSSQAFGKERTRRF